MKQDSKYIKNNVKESEIISFIFDELSTMTTDIVVKLNYRAKKYETQESRNAGTIYVEAIDGLDVFESHSFYEPEILNKIGLSVGTTLSTGEVVDQSTFENYCSNPYTIPMTYRQPALQEKRKYIIDHYVETNTYYRELNGLPPINELSKNFVRLDTRIPEIGDLDLHTPIHEYPRDVLIKLSLSGVLDEIIEEHRDKRYLKHLLDQKIPFNIARKASNFAILYFNKPKHHEELADRFVSIYNKTTEYVKHNIYDDSFLTHDAFYAQKGNETAKVNDSYYDAFIGLFILTITIQRFIVNYFKSGIKREFFNKDIIQMYLDSYGIPFYSDVALSYLTKIAKNLNMLLLFKSTDQIFIDIFELFGMKESKIYKYFLLKERLFDKDGTPVFATKEIINDYGEKEIVEDLDKMYNLRFVSIPSDSKQLSVDIIDKSNYIDYDLVVEDDVLWGGDGDKKQFLNDILKAEFNYVETKYISMTSKYEISKLGFELCYFFKLIDDLKKEESPLRIVTPLGSHNLFDVFVTMFGLASMQLNFDGNIMQTPTQVLHVLGFNFNKDTKYIEDILKDINTTDNIILKDRPEPFKSKDELLNFYFDNRRIYNTILQNRAKAKTVEEFNAYTKLYRATMITEYSTDMYKLKDGTTALTYLDYLEETDVNLYKFLKQTTDETIVENLDNILVWLEEYFKTDKFDNIFLNIPTLSLDSIKRFIFYLIDIFKSYTVDLISMNIIYHMGDKYTELIRILSSKEPIVEMTLWLKNITFDDVYEFPSAIKATLTTFIRTRNSLENVEIDVIKLFKIILSHQLNHNSYIDIHKTGKIPSTYIFEKLIYNMLSEEHDNIKLKDYLYIEEE